MTIASNGTELGVWWTPTKSEEAEDDIPWHPPERNVPALFFRQATNSWRLQTLGCFFTEDEGLQSPVSRNDLVIHGYSRGGACRSLFGASRQSRNWTEGLVNNEEVWVGQCDAMATGLWVYPDSEVEEVFVGLDVLDDWAGIGPNHYVGWNIEEIFDHESMVLKVPENIIFNANIDGTKIQLIQGPRCEFAFPKFEMELGATFKITAKMQLQDIYGSWVEPLSDLLSFLTMRDVAISFTSAIVKGKDMSRRVEMEFARENVTTVGSFTSQVSSRMNMLATQSHFESSEISVEALLNAFLQLQGTNHADAIGHLNHSQTTSIDRSVEAEIINVTKALEAYISASEVKFKNLDDQVKYVQQHSVVVGAAIAEIWNSKSQLFHNSFVNFRNLAAHGKRSLSDQQYHDVWLHAIALRWIMRDVYLSKLGLNQENVRDILHNCHLYKREMELLGGS